MNVSFNIYATHQIHDHSPTLMTCRFQHKYLFKNEVMYLIRVALQIKYVKAVVSGIH